MKKQIKLGLDVRILSQPMSGVGRCVVALLDSLRKRDILNITLFTDTPIRMEYLKHIYGLPLIDSQREHWREKLLPQQIRAQKIDVYHATWDKGVPFIPSSPTVMTIYDLFCISEKNKYLPFFKKIRRRLDLYREVRACYKILTISCNTKDDIIKYLHVSDERIIITPLDCDRGKIDIVLSSPINMQRFQAQTGGFDYFISVVGRLTDKRKNVPFLIRSFGRFMRRSQCLDKGLRLLIAGKFQELDSEYQDLLKIVREEHLTNNVFFLGHIDDIDLYWLLKRSKALIFTSLFEGFGIPILEAFYVSVPVITSNSSAMREIAADNSAIFVNPMDEDTLADAMAKIAFSSNDTIRLIRQGTSRLKYFDWEKSVDKIVEIYEQKFLLNN